ncbi:MAG: ABC transporter permease [Flavobacteriales bacterium]|nr:ABC transporter permease [Flavobacteriales bacterium]MEB2342432.1 ABC transporter permease [Flavobacteriia bacterium]
MLHLALKDLRLFLHDRRTLLITFAIPLALITLFAMAYGGMAGGGSGEPYALPVSDLDTTELSGRFMAALDTLDALSVVPMGLEQAREGVRKGDRDCVLLIHPGFADSVRSGGALPVELQYDEAHAMEVAMLQQSLMPTLIAFPFSTGHARTAMGTRIDRIMDQGTGQDRRLARERFDSLYSTMERGSSGTSPVDIGMGAEVKMTSLVKPAQGNNVGLIQAVAGTAIMMLLFSMAGIGMGLLDEKQEGTLKRLLAAPVPPVHILLGKMLSANVVSIAQLVAMFAFASLAFGLQVRAHLTGLALVILATAYACSAFGVFLAAVAKSRQQVQGLSTLIILVMSGIGGSMIPLFFMPAFMQKIAVLSVNYWGIQGFFDVLWRELPLSDPAFLGRLAALVLIGTVLNAIAVAFFRKNLAKGT